jgi:hypothetical protein
MLANPNGSLYILMEPIVLTYGFPATDISARRFSDATSLLRMRRIPVIAKQDRPRVTGNNRRVANDLHDLPMIRRFAENGIRILRVAGEQASLAATTADVFHFFLAVPTTQCSGIRRTF